jgi:DNA-binding transcriptional LysR family regulator
MRGRSIDFENYLQQLHVLLSTRAHGPSFEDAVIARFSNVQRQIYCRCQQVATALTLLRHTNCLLTVSKCLLHGWLSDPGLKIVAAPFASADVEFYAYWHASSTQEKPAVWLRETLLKALNGSLKPLRRR